LSNPEKIYRVNVAVDREIADLYVVQGTPTLIMFLDGDVIGQCEGPSPVVSDILSAISQPYES